MINWTQPTVGGYLTHQDAEGIREQLCKRLPGRFVWISHNTTYENIAVRDVRIGSFDSDGWSAALSTQPWPVKIDYIELSDNRTVVNITFSACHYLAWPPSSEYATQADARQATAAHKPPYFEFGHDTVAIWHYNDAGERIQWILKAIPEEQSND